MKTKASVSKTTSHAGEDFSMIPLAESFESSKPTKELTAKSFILLLLLNIFNSFVWYGLLVPLITYSILPYGQKALYYFSLLNPLAFPIGSLMGVRWATISIR